MYQGVQIPCVTLKLVLNFLKKEIKHGDLRMELQKEAIENVTVFEGRNNLRVSSLNLVQFYSKHNDKFDNPRFNQFYKVINKTHKKEFVKYRHLVLTPSKIDELLSKDGFIEQMLRVVKRERKLRK